MDYRACHVAGRGAAEGEPSEFIAGREFVWFSPSKGRTLATMTKAAPVVEGIDDWMRLSEPPADA